MSQFVFTVDAGYQVPIEGDAPDRMSVELTDLATAQIEAIRLCGDLLREHAAVFNETRALTVTLSDQRGLVICTITSILTPSAAGMMGRTSG